MKAAVLYGPDGPESLRYDDIDDPTPGPGQVVVRSARPRSITATSTLRAANMRIAVPHRARLRRGGRGGRRRLGCGSPCDRRAGRHQSVARVGGRDSRQGRQWRILGLPDDGTFAELVKVPAENVLPRPARLSDEEAAAIPLAGLTAYRAVVTRGRVGRMTRCSFSESAAAWRRSRSSSRRHIGARVLVTSGSDAKLESARSIGADRGFNYKTQDWVAGVREATGGEGPDLIVDGTGGPTFDQALDAARPGGRVVATGRLGAAFPISPCGASSGSSSPCSDRPWARRPTSGKCSRSSVATNFGRSSIGHFPSATRVRRSSYGAGRPIRQDRS